MAEVVSTRLTSLERVTSTGVGSVSRGARAKPNSHGRSLRPTLLNGADTMVFSLDPLLTRPGTNANDYRSQRLNRNLNGKQNTTQFLRLKRGKLIKSGEY